MPGEGTIESTKAAPVLATLQVLSHTNIFLGQPEYLQSYAVLVFIISCITVGKFLNCCELNFFICEPEIIPANSKGCVRLA